jgi:hypothetical protein
VCVCVVFLNVPLVASRLHVWHGVTAAAQLSSICICVAVAFAFRLQQEDMHQRGAWGASGRRTLFHCGASTAGFSRPPRLPAQVQDSRLCALPLAVNSRCSALSLCCVVCFVLTCLSSMLCALHTAVWVLLVVCVAQPCLLLFKIWLCLASFWHPVVGCVYVYMQCCVCWVCCYFGKGVQ